MNYQYSTPTGGHMFHAREVIDDVPKQKALCGYRPSSPTSRLMRPRAYWAFTFEDGDPSKGRPSTNLLCPRCLRRLTRLGVVS